MTSSLLFLFFFLCLQALSATVITHLPGFSGPLPFYLETGYVGVDEANDVQLFYYFIESEENPREDPVLLWLTGGPGCSALSGIAFDIGLKRHFLDSPVGTGFSYSRLSKEYEVGDILVSRHVHTFLLKWFNEHPQFLANHLYIAGDSYAGKVIPVIAEEVSEGTESGDQPALNLESAIRNCGKDLQSTDYAECANILNIVKEFISEIDVNHILEPKYALALAWPNIMVVKEDNDELYAPPSVPDITCRSYSYLLSYYWANNNMAREALHIQKGSIREWQRCNFGLSYKIDIPSSLKYHLSLTRKGFRARVYSGDHDASVPFLGTQAWIRSLNFSIVDDWRSWRVSGQVVGYTKTYANNLTFATVKSAGHTASEYRPKECLAMLRRWISHKPL